MPGLFSALNASAGTLEAYEQALNVTQNNVSNASTPGYAAQAAQFSALPFDSVSGPAGGVEFGGTQSLRDEYAEQYVQQQNTSLGTAQSTVNALSGLQSSFDITGQSGIDAALTQFSSSFLALSQDPNSTSARQQVLVTAQNVVSAFQNVASATSQASASAAQQIGATVNQINQLGSQIQQLNQQQQQNAKPDPNLDASLHNDLETLSGLVNFTSSFSQDGAASVMIDGQTPLVLGDQAFTLKAGAVPAASNSAEPYGTQPVNITDSNGRDITSQITGGQLGGLLQVHNTVLAGIQGDTSQPGSLNQLAQGFADRVNSLLTGGQISSGTPPVPGVALFGYEAGDSTAVARSLSLTSITASQIATIDPGPPSTANGVAQLIGSLNSSTASVDQINGLSINDFYGQIASGLGQQISDAQTSQTQQTQAVAQAQSLRSAQSGVSLDQEAVNLTAFQKAYEATSKLVTVLDNLTDTTINMIQ
jgi:flagellar hook-associated protein 1 FlgK